MYFHPPENTNFVLIITPKYTTAVDDLLLFAWSINGACAALRGLRPACLPASTTADEDETVDEATELKEVPSSAGHKLTSRHNTVGSVRASGGKAHGQVKSTVDGKGKPLADGKGKLTSKNNKVGGTKTGSTGGSFFA